MLRLPDASCTRTGYGIQNPATTADCWITILSMLVGICIWTYLTSILTTLLIHLNAASSEYTTKMASLNSFMAHRHLPQVIPALAPMLSHPACSQQPDHHLQSPLAHKLVPKIPLLLPHPRCIAQQAGWLMPVPDTVPACTQEMRRRIRDTYEARWKAGRGSCASPPHELPCCLLQPVDHLRVVAMLQRSILTKRRSLKSCLAHCAYRCVQPGPPGVGQAAAVKSSPRHTAALNSLGLRCLVLQVCMHTCADVIHSVPFFDDAEEGFLASLVTLLRPQVLPHPFLQRPPAACRGWLP